MGCVAEYRASKWLTGVVLRPGTVASTCFGIVAVVLLASPPVIADSEPEKVCDRYLLQTQQHLEPSTVDNIQHACRQRAAEFEARAVGYVFGTCLHEGRETAALTACLVERLGDRQRFIEVSSAEPGVKPRSGADAAIQRAEQARLRAEAETSAAVPDPQISPRGFAQQRMGQRPSFEEIEAETLLEELLAGKSLDEVTVKGLRPGETYAQAVQTLRQQWQYVKSDDGWFRPAGPASLSAAQRDGGVVQIDALDEQLGQIRYAEHFKVILDANAAREWLVQRFGDPDREQGTRIGWLLAWSSYAMRLQVKVVNEAGGAIGYQSTLEVALWSREFETRQVARKLHCDELRKIAADQLSAVQQAELQTECI